MPWPMNNVTWSQSGATQSDAAGHGQYGERLEAIREPIERLKQQSRERTERHNLASLVDELKKRLDTSGMRTRCQTR
jgi:hypothetical protein